VNKVKVAWAITSLAFGVYWIWHGISEGIKHDEWYPWYIVVLLGWTFIMWGISDLITNRTIKMYREAHENLKEVIMIQSDEIMEMQRRLRQWN